MMNIKFNKTTDFFSTELKRTNELTVNENLNLLGEIFYIIFPCRLEVRLYYQSYK